MIFPLEARVTVEMYVPGMDMQELRATTRATLNRQETAELLGVDARTVTEGIRQGNIPAIHIGRRVVIPREALLKMLTEWHGKPPSH
jgi:excisionase family DNA binding protein